ncbi:hypothetical protein [Bacillus sp. Marseille-P3661]|uniref:hypothetical protein n=1 Tax=Bacillus sp. Marseille-P3661 TaxID=1936234 RepID=UPI000C85C79B|nr:hypothetical protein [Bacillus sp. Marseille-P3661]
MKKFKRFEVLFWSIAFPGFGQYLNSHLFKGTVFIILEIIVNVMSNFNSAIRFSFLGEIDQAILVTNFQWLLFYPCIYMFAIWDAYRFASDEPLSPWAFFPFVFSAYSVTVGVFYSTKITIFDVLLGPVWLPMLFLIPGIIVGFVLKKICERFTLHKQEI